MFRYTKIAILATALTSVCAVAYAAKTMENDALYITNAKVSMVQAVTAAEQHANGRAARAEYEQTKGGWAYDVEVVKGSKVFDVKAASIARAILRISSVVWPPSTSSSAESR